MNATSEYFADLYLPHDASLADVATHLSRIADRATLVLAGSERIGRDPEVRTRASHRLTVLSRKAQALRPRFAGTRDRLDSRIYAMVYQLTDFVELIPTANGDELDHMAMVLFHKMHGYSNAWLDVADAFREV